MTQSLVPYKTLKVKLKYTSIPLASSWLHESIQSGVKPYVLYEIRVEKVGVVAAAGKTHSRDIFHLVRWKKTSCTRRHKKSQIRIQIWSIYLISWIYDRHAHTCKHTHSPSKSPLGFTKVCLISFEDLSSASLILALPWGIWSMVAPALSLHPSALPYVMVCPWRCGLRQPPPSPPSSGDSPPLFLLCTHHQMTYMETWWEWQCLHFIESIKRMYISMDLKLTSSCYLQI